MALISISEYGVVTVSKQVLSKLILDEILKEEAHLFPCNKNGKILKKGFFSGYNDMLNSIEIIDERGRIEVNIYIIVKFGASINDISNRLFDGIEKSFEIICLDKPKLLTAHIKGTYRDQLIKRNIEVTRSNE